MTIGHNSKTTKAGPIQAERLNSFIERIEKLEEERKAIGGDIKDVYSEAKGVGYDVKTMRKIVSLRAMDAADRAEAETLLDTYCHALGMVYVSADFSEDDLMDQASRIVGEVDRCMDLGSFGQLPTIRAIQDHLGCSTGKASKIRGLVQDRVSREIAKMREMKSVEAGSTGVDAGRPSEPSAPAEQSDNAVPPPGLLPASDNGKGEQPGTHSDEAPATPSVGAVAAEPRVASPFLGDDPGPIPDHLRGSSPANRSLRP